MSEEECPEKLIILNIKKDLVEMSQLQKSLLDYLDNENDDDILFQNFVKVISQNKMNENPQRVTEILYLISDISMFHHRSTLFFEKIGKILSIFDGILRTQFSNEELYNIFHDSRRVLLILKEQNYFNFDDGIIEFLNNLVTTRNEFRNYFKLEIGSQIELMQMSTHDKNDFEQKRKIAENETELCKLIRNDDVDGFVAFINQSNIPLNDTVPVSIFDTNIYAEYQISLMFYAAFFGSVDIFKYIYMHDKLLINNRSLWKAAIHGLNYEIIQLLEENNVPKDIFECIKLAIMYHHNDLVDYLLQNYIELVKQEDYQPNGKSLKYNDYISECLNLSNYKLCCEQFDNISPDCFTSILYAASRRSMYYILKFLLHYSTFSSKDLSHALNIASICGNYEIVKLLLTQNGIDINAISVFILNISYDFKDFLNDISIILLVYDKSIFILNSYFTVLQNAVDNGHAKIVELLLNQKQIDVNKLSVSLMVFAFCFKYIIIFMILYISTSWNSELISFIKQHCSLHHKKDTLI